MRKKKRGRKKKSKKILKKKQGKKELKKKIDPSNFKPNGEKIKIKK